MLPTDFSTGGTRLLIVSGRWFRGVVMQRLFSRCGVVVLCVAPMTAGAHKKTPLRRKGVFQNPQPLSPRRVDDAFSARSSGFRIILLPAPSRLKSNSGVRGFRPRLQRRVRDGFTQSSLCHKMSFYFNKPETKIRKHSAS